MRKTYIDNIRWITVVLVVLYHVFYVFNAAGVSGCVGPLFDTQYQDAVLYILYPWFMLLLFVVSGMSARFYLDGHSCREFMRSKTTKLLVPSTVGLFVFWWILGFCNIKMSGAYESIASLPKPVPYLIMSVSGIGPLWFIQMLWLFSVLLIIFRKAEKDGLYRFCGRANLPAAVLLAAVVWGASLILNTPVVSVYRFGIYGARYLLGYLVFPHDGVMERLEKGWLPLSIAALLLGLAFTLLFWGKPYAEYEVLDTPLCNIYAWIATLAVLSFMKKWGGFATAFSRYMAKKSWGLYLFHYLPLALCAFFIYDSPIPAGVKYIAVAAAAFGGAFLLYEIISRIPVLRWCVCGIGKKQHSVRCRQADV